MYAWHPLSYSSLAAFLFAIQAGKLRWSYKICNGKPRCGPNSRSFDIDYTAVSRHIHTPQRRVSSVTVENISCQSIVNGSPCDVQPAHTANRLAGVLDLNIFSDKILNSVGPIIWTWTDGATQRIRSSTKRNGTDNSAWDSFYHFITPHWELF